MEVRQLDKLIGLVRLADLCQMEGIQGDVEDVVIDQLTVECCGRIWTMACGSGLVLLDMANRKLALRGSTSFLSMLCLWMQAGRYWDRCWKTMGRSERALRQGAGADGRCSLDEAS